MFEIIPINEFRRRTGIIRKDFHFSSAVKNVVPLRDIVNIKHIHVMPIRYLRKMLLSVGTVADPSGSVYEGCRMELVSVDPHSLHVGQRYVERSNIQKILEEFPEVFIGFDIARGFTKLRSLIVVGEAEGGEVSLAHYLPPIIEVPKGGRSPMLLDGIHRSYIVRAVGTTITAILFHGVKTPFPSGVHDWNDVHFVDVKPPHLERYFDLKPEHFRNLKWVGIDA